MSGLSNNQDFDRFMKQTDEELKLVDTDDISVTESENNLILTFNKRVTQERGDKITVWCSELIERESRKTGLKYEDGSPVIAGDFVRYDGSLWQVGWYGMIAGFTLMSAYETQSQNHLASSGVPIRDFQWIHSKNDKGAYIKGYNPKTKEIKDIEFVNRKELS